MDITPCMMVSRLRYSKPYVISISLVAWMNSCLKTMERKVLSLADRLDTIVAFFGAGNYTARFDKHLYSLRRHALSIVRIIIEGRLKLDLAEAMDTANDIEKSKC